MSDWKVNLKFDLITPLLESKNPYIISFTKHDLLENTELPINSLWELSEVKKILSKQQRDGSWKYNNKAKRTMSGTKYNLLETWRQLRYLVDQYGMTKEQKRVDLAAKFIFLHQTEEGDIRGILANQYAPYYTGAIISTLIKAGYINDQRIEKSIQWLIEMRQNDGGWVIGSPGIIGISNLTTKELNNLVSNFQCETARAFDKNKPFSAAGTGMVIRAFAYHPVYQKSEYAITAAKLLKSKLFKKDNWSSYQHEDNWVRFQFPFWWNNLVSALDALSFIIPNKNDPEIQNALIWLLENQQNDGLWKISYSKIHKNSTSKKSKDLRLWISLAIGRILKRYYN